MFVVAVVVVVAVVNGDVGVVVVGVLGLAIATLT